MMSFIFLPPIIIFVLSYFKINKILMSAVASSVIIPALYLFFNPFVSEYFMVDKLDSFILLISSIVGIGVSISLISTQKRENLDEAMLKRLYRFFGVFWLGVTISILSNNMGIYWIGLEFATLSTVYMIKVKKTKVADKEAWKYLIVGAIAISLILFGIILMYASSKSVLGSAGMNFIALLSNAHKINGYLFEIGFLIAATGMFIKMGFFPMNLWLSDIERASVYPVGALFSGVLESAIMIGFFRLSLIEMNINYSHLIGFVYTYALFTLFMVSFLLYKSKDFMRLFSLSGIEHMTLIAIFWVSGGYFAALLHFAAHALLKPALFLSVGILEQTKKYLFKGALAGFKSKFFPWVISIFLLAIISLPPSPMFFSEIYGFKAMIDLAKDSNHFILMIAIIFVVLLLLSVIFYKFIHIYQEASYSEDKKEKTIYTSEKIVLVMFLVCLGVLLLPQTFDYIEGIMK
jgi:hydrogenase-4 component F